MNQSNSISLTIVNSLKRTGRKSINWIIVTGLIACLLTGAVLRTPSAAASVSASFAAHNDFATGSSPRSIAEGDFNRDGNLDLAVVNTGSNNNSVSILLGTASGTFGAKTDFATGAQPASVAVADFNGDGKPDLAVTNAVGNSVSILLGTGTGTFGAKTDFATATAPISVAVADFNSDGNLDLALANQLSGTVSILLGTGTGSFGTKTDFPVGGLPFSIAVGDFNSDGKPDLAMTNATNSNVSILLGTGSGGFFPKTDFTTGTTPVSVAVGDFNNDGQLDLAVANANSNTVSVLLGTGTGAFGAKTDLTTGSDPESVVVSDFNNDGKLDLAVSNSGSNTVSILHGTGTGTFGAKTDFATGNSPVLGVAGDFNGDGRSDLAVVNQVDNTVSVLLNTNTARPLSSLSFAPHSDFATGSLPGSVALGDFNGDGKLDMAVANFSSNSVSVRLGTGTGSFGARTDFATGGNASAVAVGDFNGDGKLDLVVANNNTATVSILLGTGTGTFGPHTDFLVGVGPDSVAVGDFNRDGKLDVAVTNFNSKTVTILIGSGTGSFSLKFDFATGSEPDQVAVGDINGDGALDLAVLNFGAETVSILLGHGTGTFGAKTDLSAGASPESLALGDFNGDGKLDLAVTKNGTGFFSSGTVAILLGTGTGTFGANTDFDTGSSPVTATVADFNGDGKLDLAVTGAFSNAISIMLGTGTGAFGTATFFTTGDSSESIAVGDLNSDGKADLVVANASSNNVSVLLNTSPGPATNLAVTQINGGVNPQAGVPFSVVVQSQDQSGVLSNVVADTNVTLSLTTGTGTLAGTLTGTITAGTNSVTISGVTYSKAESGVVITATRTSGDGLTAGNSAPFTVDPQTICITDTTQADFRTGVLTNCDSTTSPGDVILARPILLDQQNTNITGSGVGITTLFWQGQTFTPSVTGQLTKADVNLFFSGSSGTRPDLTLSVRATSGGLPTGGDLASGTITGFSGNNTASYQTATFGSPATLTAGTMYALVIRPVSNPSAGSYALSRATNVYAGGTLVSGASSGTAWSIPLNSGSSTDAGFRTYMDSGFVPSGTFVSSLKDANPTAGLITNWSTISWTATVAANTTLQFQVAASNNANGPFNFVGPDGTASTFYTTSGGSLAQFKGKRYLKYEAFFATTDAAVTATLNDVTVCFTNISANTYSDPGGICGGNTPCFTTIQAAINAAPDGGFVMIGGGTYNEVINLNRNLTLDFNNTVTVKGVIFSAGTLSGGSAVINDSGVWTNNGGTFDAGSGTVNFTGTNIGGSQATTFNNLTINAGATVTLSQNETVNGVLTLTTDLNTTSFSLTMPNTGSSAGTGDVIGTVNRTGFVSGGSALSFGNPFNTIAINSGTAPASITVKLTETVPTDSSTGQTNSGFPNAVARTYVITPTGGSGISATVKLHYKTGDLNGNSEASLNLFRFDSATGKWNNMGSSGHDTTNHAVTQSGITQFSPWTLNSTVVTAVNLDNFHAIHHNGGTLLQWQTGFEVNNLGFNIYRQQGGERVRINPSLIAGSALMVGGNVRLESGHSYSWQDDVADPTASYWLEDVDLNGTTEWHGPVGIDFSGSSNRPLTNSALLNNLSDSAARQTNAGFVREYVPGFDNNSTPAVKGSSVGSQPMTASRTPTKAASSVSSSLQKQWQIAAQPAVKIAINKTGWYHVNMTDLMAAGLSANPASLQMFVGGVEVPIKVDADSIEFYGSAIDTPNSDTQIYWLTSGLGSGKRISLQSSPGATNNNGPASFQYTVERKDRTVYFSSLRNGDAENWFGSVIATQPVTNIINVHNLDTNAIDQAQLEVALQGVTTNSHQVTVKINGQAIQAIGFDALDHKVAKFALPAGSLIEGDNQITFTAGTSGDVSLVDYIRVTYAHTYTADSNSLSTTAVGMQPIKVTGFTSDQIMAIDVANPAQPIELNGTISGDAGNYSISVDGGKRRNLIVFTTDKVLQPLSITPNHPTNLTTNAGGDFVVITHKDFAESIQPLVALRQSQGYQVRVIDVEDIYDQFNYGVHSPYAIRDFLNWTYLHWPKQPQYVLLAGSATLDPRNYSGLGSLDFVPTKLIDISTMETASDDWFVDFNNDGKPQMAIGRLPVRTSTDAQQVISKIIAYEQSAAPEGIVLVSDLNDGIDFSAGNDQIKAMVPNQLATISIVRGQTNVDAKTALMDQLTQGQRIINYAGHGSVDLWRGGLLADADVQSLANHSPSPLVVTMTCLNGYFQDPHLASLGESLLRVKQGGAVSVWASSGMSQTTDQTTMNSEFFRQLFSGPTITIGDAIKAAKAAVTNDDVRKTWVLFGDPTMRIKQ